MAARKKPFPPLMRKPRPPTARQISERVRKLSARLILEMGDQDRRAWVRVQIGVLRALCEFTRDQTKGRRK